MRAGVLKIKFGVSLSMGGQNIMISLENERFFSHGLRQTRANVRGHAENMLGLSLAPATGKLVAELLAGKTPHLKAKPYSPDRF